MDMEPRPVGAEAEPEDEADKAHNGKEAQEGGADDLGDPGGEAVVDPLHVVPGRVVALHGLPVQALDVVDGYVLVAAHFGVCCSLMR